MKEKLNKEKIIKEALKLHKPIGNNILDYARSGYSYVIICDKYKFEYSYYVSATIEKEEDLKDGSLIITIIHPKTKEELIIYNNSSYSSSTGKQYIYNGKWIEELSNIFIEIQSKINIEKEAIIKIKNIEKELKEKSELVEKFKKLFV